MEFTHNSKKINLFFGTDFIGIFCLELGYELSDLDKINEVGNGKVTNEVLKMIADVVYSTAKAYSLLHKTELQIEQYQCFGALLFNPTFNQAKFMEAFQKSLSANIPQQSTKTETSKKK